MEKLIKLNMKLLLLLRTVHVNNFKHITVNCTEILEIKLHYSYMCWRINGVDVLTVCSHFIKYEVCICSEELRGSGCNGISIIINVSGSLN
jgi:hypothetical protein